MKCLPTKANTASDILGISSVRGVVGQRCMITTVSGLDRSFHFFVHGCLPLHHISTDPIRASSRTMIHGGFLITRRMVSGFRSRLSSKTGILIERKQKATGLGSPCFAVASIILSPRSCDATVLHFPPEARPFPSISGGTYVVWEVRTRCDCSLARAP